MNTIVIRKFDMLERVHCYLEEYPIIPELPRATAARAEIVQLIEASREGAQSQISGTNERAGAVKLRESLVLELRSFLCDVNRTARVLAREHPGIRPTFRLPRTRSFPKLITAAEAIIEAAAKIEDSFLAAGMPATFLDDLRAKIAAFRDATSQKHDGSRARAASTAGLKAKASAGLAAATLLDAIVRNHFRGNAAALAAWKHARHIERGPVRRAAALGANEASQLNDERGDRRIGPISSSGNEVVLIGEREKAEAAEKVEAVGTADAEDSGGVAGLSYNSVLGKVAHSFPKLGNHLKQFRQSP